MSADEEQQRAGFSDLLNELTDSDIVIEVTSAENGRQTPDSQTIRRLQAAVETSYRALAGDNRVRLETAAVLEEVSKRSLSMWLRVRNGADSALANTPDASLLKFLARGTLAIIAWMDGSPTLQLADLQQAIRVLAWGTSVTTNAQPALPSSADLVEAISAWQLAKAAVGTGELVRVISNNGSSLLDVSKQIEEPRTLLLARRLVNHSADMIFVVEMPDYSASGQWKLRHGNSRTTAIAESGTLLDKFYRRELDIRPGDALRCKVDFETSYGPDHEVLSERYRIIEIVEVLPAKGNDEQVPPPDRMPVRQATDQLEEASS